MPDKYESFLDAVEPDRYERFLDEPEKPFDLEESITGEPTEKQGLTKPPQQLAEDMMTQLVGLDRQPETPFMERHPSLRALGKTALDMPGAVGELGEAIVSGATLGVSERVGEAGEWLSRKLFGDKPEGTWQETVLPSYVESGGKLAGAMAPIGAAGKLIAAPIIKNVIKSKHLAPFARMIGWGTAGAAYTTAEGMISEGELPTPKEIAKHGGAWAGFEAVISSLGWGGRLTLGIARLAKTWNIPKKEVLKIVMNEAKSKNMPIARYAYAKAGVQKVLGEAEKKSALSLIENIENLSKPFEKVGTYQDLTRQLVDKEISSRIESFKTYAGMGKIIGEKPKPKEIITKRPAEIERILSKPAFRRTAEEIMALKKAKVDIKYEPKIEPKKPKLFPEKKKVIPRLVEPITKIPVRKEPVKALPSGQGFKIVPETKLRKAPVPKPYEAVVEYKPIVAKTGEPFVNMKSANAALKKRGLDPTEYTIVEYRKGFAIQRFGRKVKGLEPTSEQYLRAKLRKAEKAEIVKPSIDTPESLAKEFDLRYMGEMGDLKLYSMKVPKGETTIATEGISREMLVKRMKEVKEQFKIEKVKEPKGTTLGFGPTGELQRMYEKIIKKKIPKYASIAPTRDAQKVELMYNKADVDIERIIKPTVRKTYRVLKRAVADVSGNVKKALLKKGGEAGKEAIIRHDLIRGASSKSEMIVEKASKQIYGGLSKAEEKILNRIIQSRRTIAIEQYKPGMKHPEGLGLKEHQEYLDTLPKEIFKKLNTKADIYFNEMTIQLKELKKAGLITSKSYDALVKTGDYSPRRFLHHIDPDKSYTFGGRTITVPDSGIKRLEEGSYKSLENNSRSLLAQVVTRTQSRIFRNDANKALYELAKKLPDNGIVKEAKIIRRTKLGKPIYQKVPGGFEKVSVMIEGKHKELIMPTEMAREWVISDPAINAQLSNIIGWMSGAKILRPMATGINPEFALTNFPRDIGHIWLTTHEYSKHLPIFAGQYVRDIIKTAPDAFLRKGSWIKYLEEGGGMSFLTHQGQVKSLKGRLGTLQKVLGYVGETSEIWNRLALRQRALRQGKAAHEATWIARNYLDFSQGGWFIKGIDTGVPYLNASIQATRGIFRSAKEKPLSFMYKTSQLGALSTGLYLANRFNNPECLESISDRDKVNNFIITTPLSYKDKEGNKRHLYFKVAKDQSQRIVSTIYENLMAKYLGEEINIDQVTQAAQDFIPIIPTQVVPPTFDAIMGYYANKDFWRNEDIWKRQKVTSKEEYTAYTPLIYIKAGEMTGLSPERTKYALQQYFTYGNIYTSVVGGGLNLLLKDVPKDKKEEVIEDMLRKAPFIRRALKVTRPYTKHEKEIKRIKLEESTQRYKITRDLDALSKTYYSDKTSENKLKIREFIKQQPVIDRKRLLTRFRRYGKLHSIPDKRWWLNLMSLSPEARAVVYWTRYQQADNEGKERLKKYYRQIPGIRSKRFINKLNRLRKAEKKKSRQQRIIEGG